MCRAATFSLTLRAWSGTVSKAQVEWEWGNDTSKIIAADMAEWEWQNAKSDARAIFLLLAFKAAGGTDAEWVTRRDAIIRRDLAERT